MDLLLQNGRVVCPETGRDELLDVLCKGGRIAAVEPPGKLPRIAGSRLLDAAGLWIVPSLFDLHVHLREPGGEHKETIRTGLAAAAAGGFSDVCCMPNTQPVNDCPEITRLILDRAAGLSVRVHPVAALTRGLAGKEINDYPALRQAGAAALSDDGKPVPDARVMRKAMERARDAGLTVCAHCEEPSLFENGVVNEGTFSARSGFAGISWASETIGVLRDISLAELTGCRLHICHVSARQSVQAVFEAKARGVPVTCETAPHYFTLTEEAVADLGSMAKMNPPLRTAEDVAAVRRGLADGTIDAIATDHAPHAIEDKEGDIARAAFGISGLETAVSLSLVLVHERVLPPLALVRKLTVDPARILGLPRRGVIAGAPADLTVINPAAAVCISAERFYSKGKNTPFAGMELSGKVEATLIAGEFVFASETICLQ
ncbi:MAG: dihydroorotase [Thermodesulfobacteriota bacterium]